MSTQKYDVEKLLSEGKAIRFPISGWSMYPFLSDGDIVTIEPIQDRKLHINDVIVYRRTDGPLIIHRIMKITNDGFWFCGDNQSSLEGPLQRKQLLGIMTSFSHNGMETSSDQAFYRIASAGWRVLCPFRPGIAKTVHTLKQFLK